MLLFSAVSLYRCLKDYFLLARGRPAREQLRLAVPVLGLVVCILIMAGWLQWNHIGFHWALLILAVTTLVTLGLMRIVAEGGIYWFQAHTGFIHLYKIFGLGKFLAPVVLAPFLLVYSVLFLDIKTFMAPNLLNAARMHSDTRSGRGRFHLNLVLCLVVSIVVSLGFTVFLAHLRGAQQMHSWFYTNGPKRLMERAAQVSTQTPEVNWPLAGWYSVGAAWVALSMWVRQSLFWFPHPVGYIMLINPLMGPLWFSFFLGWICKKFVVTYGGKKTFDTVRVVFVGLILGELLAVGFWSITSLIYAFNARGITLNRYGP